MSKLCTTCWDEPALQGSKQCARCMQYRDGDPEWISPGHDLTPTLMELLDKLAAGSDVSAHHS